jgi:hypothetical protein
MNRILKSRLPLAIGAVLAVALIALVISARSAQGRVEEASNSSAAPHYSVVLTEAHNLLVTDNATNKIYFYTIDHDKPIGSPLKLRASLDLTQVGKDEIRLTTHNLENFKPESK